ncbi:glycosyltransferase involved in cell wall biosynthesis [Collimonas sp. PA-H2]|uniref:glycosyltransferase family 4 protein n=1 Tax=Collimonas sp. PA-H2 TaxID=1881062 RepID=UPI000BF2A86A|nr:glycosyltransferase family 4 protein [Collimonas sp. PA-H2]PFH10699.1 glycosyltransferase involved in cell wall biosynthesis [Collimonas sp. PA-H2]
MRILLLTQWFDPEPTFKGLLFARKLQQLGHEVEVITGFPNYPGGKLYPGFRQTWRKREEIDGVVVTRVPLYPSHDGSAVKRLLNYFSFALTSCLYGVFGAKKADVIYVYHPPMTVGLSGALIGMFRNTPFVYDIQDLWPDTLRATGMIGNERALGIVSSVCNWIYRRASHIVVLSPGFQKLLIERGVSSSKMSVIYNWCDETSMQIPEQTALDLSFMVGRFNIVFAGNMGKAQALNTVIEAAKIIESQNAEVQFVFVGGGIEVDNLKAMSVSAALKNVRFLPRMPMNEVGAVLSKADALLVHLKDDPLFEITIPSKTQAYLAVGKPILMAVSGDAADLVRRAEAGIAVKPENAASLADGVLQMTRLSVELREEMGKKAIEFYQKELSLDVGVERFIEVFNQVAIKKNTLN